MKSFILTLFIFGHVLASQMNISCLTDLINADKVRHNSEKIEIQTIAVQHKITNIPDTSIRILRELLAIAGAGDQQDQEPAPSSSSAFSYIPPNNSVLQGLGTQPRKFSPAVSTIHPTTFHPTIKSVTAASSSKKIAVIRESLPGTNSAVSTMVGTTSNPFAGRAFDSHRSSYPPRRTVGSDAIDPVDMNKSALMPQSATAQMAQIISLDVDCAKESMVVKIKFDRPFNGLIYSKGFHSNLDCHHVRYGTNRDSYEFTIRLNSCGSHWVDALTSGKKAYLENVIIIQNQRGIQEIRDISRSICCFWEGLLNKTVSYAFNIDMLDTKNVSFSGGSVRASMDVQVGNGPNAPSVNGLVKIGDILTMVVVMEGDPGLDFRVLECIAHDGNRSSAVTLSDKNGCIVMNKLMGPWQKTAQTERFGVSLTSFAFFQAFKFPDQMEVFLECNVELCKFGCDVCPEDDATLFDISNRKRRSINSSTSDISDVRLRRSLRVISSDDIAFKSDSHSVVTLTSGNHQSKEEEEICMPLSNFISGLVVILLILVISCIMTAFLCVKMRLIGVGTENISPLSSTFHSFSSSAFKP